MASTSALPAFVVHNRFQAINNFRGQTEGNRLDCDVSQSWRCHLYIYISKHFRVQSASVRHLFKMQGQI